MGALAGSAPGGQALEKRPEPHQGLTRAAGEPLLHVARRVLVGSHHGEGGPRSVSGLFGSPPVTRRPSTPTMKTMASAPRSDVIFASE